MADRLTAHVEIIGEVRQETEHGLLLYDGSREVWLPKSQFVNRREIEGGLVEIDIPEWIARDKGLI